MHTTPIVHTCPRKEKKKEKKNSNNPSNQTIYTYFRSFFFKSCFYLSIDLSSNKPVKLDSLSSRKGNELSCKRKGKTRAQTEQKTQSLSHTHTHKYAHPDRQKGARKRKERGTRLSSLTTKGPHLSKVWNWVVPSSMLACGSASLYACMKVCMCVEGGTRKDGQRGRGTQRQTDRQTDRKAETETNTEKEQ